jgi:hypothetical protein
MKKVVLGIALLTGMMACEKDAKNIPIPFEKKLVIESYLSPQDEQLLVRVGQNYPTVGPGSVSGFGTLRQPVTNAVVTLSDGQRSVVLPFRQTPPNSIPQSGPSPDSTGYRLSAAALPIVPGRTYTLRVTAPGYPDAEATCTIPLRAVEASTAEISRGTESDVTGNRDYFQAVFQDLAGEENFYSTYFALNNTVTPPPTQGKPSLNVTTQGTQFLNQGTTDGGKLKSARVYVFPTSQVPTNWLQTRQLELIIATTDRAYYDYNRTLRNQYRNDDNPFAEPVLIYSNVRGGLGVFAGYQLSRVVHTL